MKKKSQIALRHERIERQDAQIQAALSRAKRKEKQADDGPMKRKPNAHLSRYLELSLESRHRIRDEEGYTAKSYNLSRQVLGLIDHLYVRYPVPKFLYRTMLSREGLKLVFGDAAVLPGLSVAAEYKLRPWFLAVARGDSFAKLARDTFTKKEAHWFLMAPDYFQIPQNVLWARAAAAGVPRSGCDYVVQRFEPLRLRELGDRLPDLLRFYAEHWTSLSPSDRDEITDFIRAAIENPAFTLKGRTVGSLKKLARDWHRTLCVGLVGKYRSWPTGLFPWEIWDRGRLVRAAELTNNRALAEEGQSQRHCVFTYVSSCLDRYSRIVSMRWYETGPGDTPVKEHARLTLEVWPHSREIWQVRGRSNRPASDEEMAIVRKWASAQGLTVGKYV